MLNVLRARRLSGNRLIGRLYTSALTAHDPVCIQYVEHDADTDKKSQSTISMHIRSLVVTRILDTRISNLSVTPTYPVMRLTIALVAISFSFACGTGNNTSNMSVDAQTQRSDSTAMSPSTQTTGLDTTAEPESTPAAIIEPETDVISELQAAIPAATTPIPATREPLGCEAPLESLQVQILELINTARSSSRTCGTEFFNAASPLSWNSTLASAARVHASDMANNDFFSHTGSDGSSASNRVTAAGYDWRSVGENIAAGRDNASVTVDDWLDSPGHCRNIMNATFEEMAVSCVENAASTYGRYWTQVLAAAR